jgi:hypothetical protein
MGVFLVPSRVGNLTFFFSLMSTVNTLISLFTIHTINFVYYYFSLLLSSFYSLSLFYSRSLLHKIIFKENK